MSERFVRHSSSLGELTLVSDGAGLLGVYFEKHAPAPKLSASRGEDAILTEARRQLDQALAGKRRSFDLALRPRGTAFQLKVWARIAQIPYGETLSYGALADEIGSPGAARAVGAATGRNPLSIVVPCHRVVGAGGALTGYAGGLSRKVQLLALERGERDYAARI